MATAQPVQNAGIISLLKARNADLYSFEVWDEKPIGDEHAVILVRARVSYEKIRDLKTHKQMESEIFALFVVRGGMHEHVLTLALPPSGKPLPLGRFLS